jgi:hypothetical protein
VWHELFASLALLAVYGSLGFLAHRLWFVETDKHTHAWVVLGLAALPTLHFTMPLRQFLRDVIGIPHYDENGRLRAAVIENGKPIFDDSIPMDSSSALRARLGLFLGLVALMPVTFAVFGVGVPALHSVLLRLLRVRWPLWYAAIDLFHTCALLPFIAAALLQVRVSVCACVQCILAIGWL